MAALHTASPLPSATSGALGLGGGLLGLCAHGAPHRTLWCAPHHCTTMYTCPAHRPRAPCTRSRGHTRMPLPTPSCPVNVPAHLGFGILWKMEAPSVALCAALNSIFVQIIDGLATPELNALNVRLVDKSSDHQPRAANCNDAGAQELGQRRGPGGGDAELEGILSGLWLCPRSAGNEIRMRAARMWRGLEEVKGRGTGMFTAAQTPQGQRQSSRAAGR